MASVNIQEAKTHLSRLVERAVRGEEVVIARAGRPCVRLVPVDAEESPRPLGAWAGRVQIAPDFDAPDAAITALFEGSEVPGRQGEAKRPGKLAAPKPAPRPGAKQRARPR